MSFYSNELQVGNFQIENLLMLKDLTSNFSNSIIIAQNKTFTKKPQTLEQFFCTNLKFHLKFATMAKNSFWHTWNFQQFENLSYTHLKLQRWNSQ